MKNLTNIYLWIKSNIVILLVIIIASILRFHKLEFQSIWYDEVYTMLESNPNKSFIELYNSLIKKDVHPPLFVILLRCYFHIFDYSLLCLRIFSAVLGVLGVFGTYILGKELVSKRTGIVCSFLVSINYFHLYYSQEGRMYSLLFLTSILAYIFLIRLIKKINFKYSLLYCISSILMIYSHFYGLFALVSQIFFVIFFLLKEKNIIRKKFFIRYAFCIVCTLISYFPIYEIIFGLTGIESFWISYPPYDIFSQIYSKYFGESEILVMLSILISIKYFNSISSNRALPSTKIEHSPLDPNITFILIFSWIFIVVIISMYRSYTATPMIVPRYFIVILPPIILIIGFGISTIKDNYALSCVILIYFFISMINIIEVKKYYRTPTKAQYREITNFIITKNQNQSKIYCTEITLFTYFIKSNIEEISFEKLINVLRNEGTREFWFANHHNEPFILSDSSKLFLNKNYQIKDSLVGIDSWAYHFLKRK